MESMCIALVMSEMPHVMDEDRVVMSDIPCRIRMVGGRDERDSMRDHGG
jgi:hypothetical protein